MQIGKISGLALIVLGILRCGLQFIQWTLPAKAPAPPDQSVAQPERKPLPCRELLAWAHDGNAQPMDEDGIARFALERKAAGNRVGRGFNFNKAGS